MRGLAVDLLNGAHDVAQLQRAWESLEPAERQMPELAIHAAQRLTALGGDAHWRATGCCRCGSSRAQLGDGLKVKLVRALEAGLDSLDGAWLARIEAAQKAQSARCHLAVPGRHGLHEAPALGQGAAAT